MSEQVYFFVMLWERFEVRNQVSSILLGTTLGVLVGLGGSGQAAIVEYTEGHGDIGLVLEGPGDLFLHYHFGTGSVLDGSTVSLPDGVEVAPADAYVRVRDAAKITLPVPAPFLGANIGDTIWVLPQGNTAGLPFLGIAAEELETSQFASAGFRMTSFNGPAGGNFALWQSSPVGNPTVYFQTNDGVDPLVDLVSVSIGGHDHYNFGFTLPGLYEVGIEGFASGQAGNLTDTGVFRFAVGDSTAVPEPSSLLFLAAGSLVAMRMRRRQVA